MTHSHAATVPLCIPQNKLSSSSALPFPRGVYIDDTYVQNGLRSVTKSPCTWYRLRTFYALEWESLEALTYFGGVDIVVGEVNPPPRRRVAKHGSNPTPTCQKILSNPRIDNRMGHAGCTPIRRPKLRDLDDLQRMRVTSRSQLRRRVSAAEWKTHKYQNLRTPSLMQGRVSILNAVQGRPLSRRFPGCWSSRRCLESCSKTRTSKDTASRPVMWWSCLFVFPALWIFRLHVQFPFSGFQAEHLAD